jgi:hypothetical protein
MKKIITVSLGGGHPDYSGKRRGGRNLLVYGGYAERELSLE